MGKKVSSKDKCKRYRTNGTREKNKKRKLIRHMKKYPNDTQAKTTLDNI